MAPRRRADRGASSVAFSAAPSDWCVCLFGGLLLMRESDDGRAQRELAGSVRRRRACDRAFMGSSAEDGEPTYHDRAEYSYEVDGAGHRACSSGTMTYSRSYSSGSAARKRRRFSRVESSPTGLRASNKTSRSSPNKHRSGGLLRAFAGDTQDLGHPKDGLSEGTPRRRTRVHGQSHRGRAALFRLTPEWQNHSATRSGNRKSPPKRA